jgi:uncharacterized protein YcfL
VDEDMKKNLVLLMMLSLVMVSCKGEENNQLEIFLSHLKNTQIVEASLKSAINQTISMEDNVVEYDFLTKEELLNFIEENQTSEIVGITSKDLAGIDVEDFIRTCFITEDSVAGMDLKFFLHNYILVIRKNDMEPFSAKELINVESSPEEFEAFKDTYFENLNITYEFLYVDEYGIENYNFIMPDKTYEVLIGQTTLLSKNIVSLDPDGTYYVVYEDDPSLFYPIKYSKNSKYFILCYMYDDNEYNFIKTFYEIEE